MHLRLLVLFAVLLPGCAPAASVVGGTSRNADAFRPLALEEVADPELLAAALAAHPLLSGAADTSLVLIAYDSSGALRSARVYHRAASAEESRAVDALLREKLAAAATPRSLGWYFLTTDAGPRLVGTDPPATRPPRILNLTELTQVLQRLARRPQMRDASVRVRIFIDTDGTVGTAEIVGSSGSIEIDRELLNVARLARFTTAHLEAFAVCAWVVVPITLRWNDVNFPADGLAYPGAYNSSTALRGPGF